MKKLFTLSALALASTFVFAQEYGGYNEGYNSYQERGQYRERGHVRPANTPQNDPYNLVESFNIEKLNSKRYVFTVRGRPDAQASVYIDTLNATVPLQQVEPGIYEGYLTLRSGQRLPDNYNNFVAQVSQGSRQGFVYQNPASNPINNQYAQPRNGYNNYSGVFPAGHPSAPFNGFVESVEQVNVKDKDNAVPGMVVGGVVGGLLGNQVGGGSGRDIATIAGVLGGAYAGKKLTQKEKTVWRASVRMDDGTVQNFDFNETPQLQQGDRVRNDEGKLSVVAQPRNNQYINRY